MTDHSSKRRAFLRSLGGLGVAGLAGCISESPASSDGDRRAFKDDTQGTPTPRPTPSGPADETFQLRAAESTVQSAPDSQTRNWVYDGEFPGPELRVAEGDVLRAEITNELPEETTIHWHGVPVPNSEDGVPNVTQQPIGTGESYSYKYRAEPAGTYLYHSHVGLQLDRGLGGPLVIEEESPHVEYDREYVVLLDDYLDGEPQLPSGFGGGRGGPGGGGGGPDGGGGGGGGRGPGGGGGRGPGGDGGMGGDNGPDGDGNGQGPGGDGGGQGPGGGMGQMGDHRPPYEGLLVNGRLPTDPPTFDVKQGERVRFRFVNASSATNFRVRLAGHRFSVSHADGRPVDPVTVDSFAFGSGERYDAVVTAENPGAWELQADALDGDEPPARAVVTYEEGADGRKSPNSVSSGGRHLQYGDLRALNPIQGIGGQPDRTFDFTLSRGMGGDYEWYIDGQAYPDADPLRISEGDHVRVRMVNRSPVVHPMHLHGHFFQVGDAVKDTVRVPPRMGEVTFDFVADNPGDWLFHCHNLYHLEAGMARVFTYE